MAVLDGDGLGSGPGVAEGVPTTGTTRGVANTWRTRSESTDDGYKLGNDGWASGIPLLSISGG